MLNSVRCLIDISIDQHEFCPGEPWLLSGYATASALGRTMKLAQSPNAFTSMVHPHCAGSSTPRGTLPEKSNAQELIVFLRSTNQFRQQICTIAH